MEGNSMGWIGIVSIDGAFISDGAVASKEKAKRQAERLLKRMLNLKADKHGLIRFRACKVNWSDASISDERPFCINLSRVGIVTTAVRQQ